MAGHCRGPVWRSDDFSRCIQHEYLQALFPLVSCGVSLLYLAYQITRATQKSTRAGAEYSPLKQDAGQANGTYHDSDEEDDTDEEEDELRRSQDVALELAKTKASVVELDRPRGELVIAIVEEVAVLGILGIQVAALILQTWGRKGDAAAQASVLVWAYIAILASLRLLLSTTSKWSFRSLWYHTFFLYGFQWICVIVQFRSQIIHPRSRTAAALTSAYFALTTVLALISLTSRKGNRAVELEYEGSLEPSREPLASVFALATFSWVDPIVWTGYKKTYEMKDVWNLMPKDKAAAILRDYRQVKKTNILAWHLLGYFKRSLLVQAAWAAMSGVITFVPTLLLKVILEYIEDPLATPRNAAWLYVILLFVSGILNALSTGQALWIGRKICIRLRAIIIGEIYAKALRRRAGAAPDKVLGQGEKKDDNENKQSIVKRLTSFGRKKKAKSDDAKVPAVKTSEPVDESQVTSGAIINLMAVDSFKVAEISSYLHFLWAETPVQFVLAIALLYLYLGTSSFVGIGMMGLLFPVNMYIAKQFTSVQKKILAATDARIHVTNEVLTNVRIIKYFAWEQRFLASVDEKRVVEMKHLRNRFIVWSAAATIWSGAPVLITFFTFMFYTLVEKKDLVPSVAFTALSLFSLLRIPLDQLADMVAHVQESKVSVDRIEEYLNEPETDKYVQLQGHEHDEDGEPLIGFEQGTFSWGGKDDDDFKMIDLDMNFKVGQLNVIVGPTGSGKTSMLMALLGEMKLLAGHVHLPGGRSREDLKRDPNTGLTEGVAYCAQQAWLVNGTVKDNIVFASKWDARRYKDVIVACSLQRDLEILDSGDQTLVGEKGVTLSGGQKQRISLARALYCDARHVLMDDVLSAVDSHTAKWIFDKALMGPLMYNRTCILVTHNAVLALPHAEFAVVLENGRVTAQGSASEVIGSGKLAEDITKFPSAPPSRPASVLPSRVPPELAHDEDEVPIEPNGTAHGQMSRRNTETNGAPFGDPLTSAISKDIPGMNKSADTETKATGAVKLSIILMYLRYMGGTFYWIIAALCFALQQVSQVATNVWIREWANSYTKTESTLSMTGIHTSPVTHVRGGISTSFNCLRSGSCNWNIPFWTKQAEDLSSFKVVNSDVDISYYLGVYAALGLAYMLITLLREGVLFGGSLMASTRIHRQLMTRVTHAKFRFFDTTPLGQIMNRFSKDIEALDQEVAPVAVGVVHCLFSILTIVILISVITPAFLIAAVFITLIYIAIGKVYINASRDLKRLESVQRSPLYQQFGETLSGMTTIRAYGDERRFIRDNLNQVNTHSRPFIFLWASNRWLSFRVDFVGALVAFLTGAFVISGVGKIDAGAAGLAMTYAVTFTENVLWFVRLYATNEQNMNAVERVKEYLDVDQEADSIIEDKRPEANWPSKGSVEFIDYSTRYRSDFDFVLKNISFKILPGEKVGVVGRTGAGKSSLALALFRALEAEKGTILIDDVDISQIGLQDLRENIVMVPQDPTLFTGTIRSNLDPFGLFTDEEIFTALRGVQLVGSATSTAPSRAPSPPRTPVTQSHKQSPNGKTAVAFTRELASTSESSSPIETSTMENKNIFRNLSSPVAESGSNLSQGQRQLLCLARAMLKAPKVLLMDEATASIDYATDSKIQETIREIKNTTITIAHRLQTIIDYDKVLVLDKGEVVEYGDPYDLISRTDGIFHGMCEMTGDLDVLVKDAKKAHDGRKLVDDQ